MTAGSNASFSVAASGDALRYQWLRDNVAIVGATGTSYTTPTVLGDNGARFSVLVYNSAGLLFSQPATLTVTASVAEWVTPAAIETDDTGDAQQPSIAVNAAGEAVAVWMQPGGGVGINIWANRYTPAGGWGTAQRISDGQGGAQGAQAVAIDASGHAIAVWQQADHIWANRYTPGTGWGTPVVIDVGSGSAGNPQIAMDASGNALAVWWQHAGGRVNVESVRYVVGAGWGNSRDPRHPTTPATPPHRRSPSMPPATRWSHGPGRPTPAAATTSTTSGRPATCRALAGGMRSPWTATTCSSPISHPTSRRAPARTRSWSGTGETAASTTSSRATTAPAAAGSQSLETDPAVVSRNARVAIDSAGNALAVWEQYVGATANVMASRYNGGTWDAPTLIETDNAGSAHTPQIVIDANGIGTAVWSQRNAAGFTDNVWVNRYTPGGGWGSAVTIDGQPEPATQPALGVDALGGLVVVWEQTVGSLSHLWASSYR